MYGKRNFEEAFEDCDELMVDLPYFSYKLSHTEDQTLQFKSYGNLCDQIKELFPELEEDVIMKIIRDGNYSLETIMEQLKNTHTANNTNNNETLIDVSNNEQTIEEEIQESKIPVYSKKKKYSGDKFSEQICDLLNNGESEELVRNKWAYEFIDMDKKISESEEKREN